MSLLFIAVAAKRLSVSTFFSWVSAESSMSTAISLTLLTAIAPALRRPFMIVCELTPCSTRSRTSFKISPANTTTEVVPSPTSASWERAISVRMRAAGWTISKSYREQKDQHYSFARQFDAGEEAEPTFITVAPSFVIVCRPLASTSRRSPPYGPSVLLTVDCTATQALMLEIIWPFP